MAFTLSPIILDADDTSRSCFKHYKLLPSCSEKLSNTTVVVTCAAGYVYLKHLSEIDADIARVDAMIPPQVQPYVNQARATLERLY